MIQTQHSVDAEAIVENAYITDLENREYSLSISLTHRGEFVKNKIAYLIDRDGVTTYQGTIKGIVSSIDTTQVQSILEMKITMEIY